MDDRKEKILRAIIQDYIESAEPVGSRTIARKYDLGVSPATIRNEMADLEELGYLEHLHTSSGRIPSSKGYRFYVDDLLTPHELSDAEKSLINEWYRERVKRTDEVFRETVRLIARITRNVSMILAPAVSGAAFRCLQFLPLGSDRIIAVLMTDAGFEENRIIRMPDGASMDDFQRISRVINKCLEGLPLSKIPKAALKAIRDEIRDEVLYETAIEVIQRSLDKEKKERLYLGGASEMLSQPEFHDVKKVQETLLMLEEGETLKNILRSRLGNGMSVTIGRENENTEIQDFSIITATCRQDGEVLGTFAVLGPTRMEYAKSMTLLKYINDNLSDMIRHLSR